MRPLLPRAVAAALALAALLAAPRPAAAAVAAPFTVEGLARGADAVVRGRVLARQARWSSGHGRILTDVEIEAAEVWSGQAPRRLTVVVPGGAVDGIGQEVAGAPAFTPGEEVVVFLTRAGRAFQVRGLAQGKFAVASGRAAPDLSGFRFVQAPAARAGERRVEAMPLDELRRRVRGAR